MASALFKKTARAILGIEEIRNNFEHHGDTARRPSLEQCASWPYPVNQTLGSGAVSKMSGKRIAVDTVYIKSIACCLLPMNSKRRKEKHP